MSNTRNVRVPEDIHAIVKASAQANGRTWTGELRFLILLATQNDQQTKAAPAA